MSIQIRVAGLVASAIVASAASAQTAVEWKVSEGGNGHWYQLMGRQQRDWYACRALAEEHGGHLITVTSSVEWQFLIDRFPNSDFVGGAVQQPESPEPAGGWQWCTGEPFVFTAWYGGNPDNGEGKEHALQIYTGPILNYGNPPGWNDMPIEWAWWTPKELMVEWDADCNGDGIVDYGQILRGELIDLNANGVPDICETSISSVIPPSVPSQGGSTITIRGNFPPNPTVKVGGVVATSVSRTSITQITATVPALMPGMASVQVNDFTLPDAIYIRPECGSDLDQNGTVDAGDISIILLDFGPCYEPPAPLVALAPKPRIPPEDPDLKPRRAPKGDSDIQR
jgi:hypothetical protein